jgi:hypothetical protein
MSRSDDVVVGGGNLRGEGEPGVVHLYSGIRESEY